MRVRTMPPGHVHRTLLGQKLAAPHCEIHTDVALVCLSCLGATGGAVGGLATTKAKAKASARNGRLGGRPKLAPHSPTIHKNADDPGYKLSLGGCRGCEARR